MREKKLLFNATVHEWAKLTKDQFLARIENVRYLRTTSFIRPYWFETAEDFHGLRELHTLINHGDFTLSTQTRHKLFAIEIDAASYTWLRHNELGTIQRQIVAWMAAVYVYNSRRYPQLEEIIYAPVLEQIRELHREYYPESMIKDYWGYWATLDETNTEEGVENNDSVRREVPQDDVNSYRASCFGLAGCPPAEILRNPFRSGTFDIHGWGTLHCACAYGRTGYFTEIDWTSIVIADIKKAQKFFEEEYGQCHYDVARLKTWIDDGKTDDLARAEGDMDMMTKWRHTYGKPTTKASEPYSLFDGEPSHGYIYVLRNGDYNQYKIGWTKLRPEEASGKSVSKRKAGNQTGNPEPLIEVGHFRASSERIEKRLHRMFENRRIRGEWFELTDQEVSNLLSPEWRSSKAIY